MQIGKLAELYGIPPHELLEWDWKTREFNSTVAAAREAFEADLEYEQRRKQRNSSSKKPNLEPPEHGFDFSNARQKTVLTESGHRISPALADDQNVVVVEDDEQDDTETD